LGNHDTYGSLSFSHRHDALHTTRIYTLEKICPQKTKVATYNTQRAERKDNRTVQQIVLSCTPSTVQKYSKINTQKCKIQFVYSSTTTLPYHLYSSSLWLGLPKESNTTSKSILAPTKSYPTCRCACFENEVISSFVMFTK
jgi:hypothetical protein